MPEIDFVEADLPRTMDSDSKVNVPPDSLSPADDT